MSCAAGVHCFLHRRRHGQRHGAGLRLYRPPGAPRGCNCPTTRSAAFWHTSPAATAQPRDITTANAYALLGELNHYSDPRHAYPGDPAAGLSPFAAEDAPFNDAYVVHLGEELDADGFAAAIDKLATFLYYGSLSTAAAYFDRCRAGLRLQRRLQPSFRRLFQLRAIPPARRLRTFGLCPLGFSPDDVPREALDDLCRGLILRWRGGEAGAETAAASLSDPTSLLAAQFARDASPDQLRSVAAERTAAAGIAINEIVPQFHARLAEQMGNDRQVVFAQGAGGTPAQLRPAAELPGARFHRAKSSSRRWMKSSVTKGPRIRTGSAWNRRWTRRSRRSRPRPADNCGSGCSGWSIRPNTASSGAQNMADHLGEHLREISRLAGESLQAVVGKLRSLKELLLGDRHGGQELAAIPRAVCPPSGGRPPSGGVL